MATGGQVAPRRAFVGRRPELAALGQAMEAARAGAPQIIWIEGPPGIGKTAFVRRFLSGVQGVSVLEASGDESETTLDYGVILQLVAQGSPDLSWDALEGRIDS